MNGDERRFNSVMATLLAEHRAQSVQLSPALSHYLSGGVTERDGFILLVAETARAAPYNPSTHFDETGYECLVNHVHIDRGEVRGNSSLEVSLNYADGLVSVLKRSGYAGPFRIILSYSLDERACIVRFHRVRAGQSWLSDNLDGYAGEGILVIDC